MANNLTANIPAACVAKQTVLFSAIAAIDNTSIAIIYEVGDPLKSYVPGRGINPITGFTIGKGYYIVPKTDLDLSTYLAAPFAAEDKVRASALMYNLDAVLSKPVGTPLTITAEEPGSVFVQLGTYTTQSGDSDPVTLAQQLAGTVRTNSATTGYYAFLGSDTVKNDSFLVIARGGLGATINGKELTVSFSGGSVGTFFEDGL
jgi:hypothetical protein